MFFLRNLFNSSNENRKKIKLRKIASETPGVLCKNAQSFISKIGYLPLDSIGLCSPREGYMVPSARVIFASLVKSYKICGSVY